VRKLRVGVLFGGQNSEHDLSCDSAADVLTHLNRGRFDLVPVRIAEDGMWRVAPPGEIPALVNVAELKALTSGSGTRAQTLDSAITVLGSVDVVLSVLHGTAEEYGTVQSLLDRLGVPYVGNDAGVIGMDTELAKAVLRAGGIEVTDPDPVEPDREIGISVLEHPDGRVVASSESLAALHPEVRAALAAAAIGAFRVLGCSGLIGVELHVREEGDRTEVVLDTVSTRPRLALRAPYLAAWGGTGLTLTDLLDVLVDTALARGPRGRTAHRRPSAQPDARAQVPAGPQARGITIFGCAPDEAVLFRELAPRLGATIAITADPVSEANAALATGTRHVSVSHKTRITNPALDALRAAGVEYISTRSVGFNHIDVDYASSIGMTVENIAYSPDSVADFTLMLMLMSLRHMKSVVLGVDEHDYRLNSVRGRELRDLTVGVIGTGRIGVAVMDRLRGFGCRILAYDRNLKKSAAHVSLDELLQQSDIVTLHAPLTRQTHHLLNQERIERMKPGAFVINTGRGPLIDTEALVAALDNGGLGGAALDVVEGEEGIFYQDCRNKSIENKSMLRLQEMPNVIISPHTAYYTDHALSDTVENSIINCLKFESGNQRG
jgi:D-specific alpha-keto acid dehydrogenase